MRSLLLFLMLSCFAQLHANTYYFSTSTGIDSRSATEAQSASTPWRSLDKLNAIFSTLNAGDNILFKRDEVFDGAIVISRSGSLSLPITFGAYGSGAKPVINGLTTLGNWYNTGGGIWESSYSSSSMINTVLMNGIFKEIGRYPNFNTPNKGYLTYESLSGNSSITDNELPASPDWTGGEVVIKKERWVVDRNLITRHSGNTIQYISQSGYGGEPNFGYFIQNHPKTLDVEGEWYYKVNEGKFGMYLPSGNASSLKIQVSSVQTLVSINNQSNIVFQDLSFQGPNNAAFNLVNAQHIRISGCDILFSGVFAVNGKDCNDLTIENGIINQTNNVALNLDNCANTIIRNNTINNSGITPGMGMGDSGSYEAIVISGDNVLIDHNSIENTGYIAVTFRGSSNVVSNNFINNFASVKDDAAGIYSWNNIAGATPTYGLKVINNVILNGIGAPEGTIWPGYRPASGIYMDDNISNVEVTGNTAANCGLYGAYIHNAYNINLANNLFYNNASQVVLISDEHALQSPVRNVNVTNNIMVAREYYQRVAEYKTYVNDLPQFGNFDNNYYTRPVDDNQVIYPSYFINGTYNELSLTLDQWKALYGKDANSKKSPVTVPGADHIRFEYNSTSSAKTIALDKAYIDVKGQTYTGSLTLDPYSSIILLPQNAVIPPVTNCQNTGSILREQWNNIAGNDISLIPLDKAPSVTSQMTSLESSNIGDSYGARMRGYICPPQTGNYTFMASGDDQVELWLSTDNNPANKRKIASVPTWTNLREFTKYPTQQSDPIALQAGQLYYIEVLHKNGDGGNHVTIGWVVPFSGLQVPIPGDRLVPYDAATITPPPTGTTSGLNYKYYEGNWDVLPDFNALTPVKTGTTPNVDISVKNINEYFGLLWEGYINIPTAGNYTFETVSDDGSKFYFNSAYAANGNALVNNDGLHAAQSATGVVNVPAAGSYPVAISFFQKSGGESMQLYWTGPGITRQLVPDAAFIKGAGSSDNGCSATGSILHEIWQNIDGNDIASIPVNTTAGIINQVTSLETSNLGDSYGERIRGYICAPQSGDYTFMVSGDDAVELWLSTDDNPNNKIKIASVISWTDLRQFDKYPGQRSGIITLQSGHKYYIEILHKEGAGSDHVTVAWQVPGSGLEVPIPGSRLSPFIITNTPPPATGCSASGTILRERWDNVGGGTVSAIPVASTPSSISQIGTLETSNTGSNYGERIRGYICPPVSGNYMFMISGDDNVELWLSSDDNPANKIKIAGMTDWTDFRQFDKYASQKSVAINLESGRRYYIEALHKQAAGGDHVTVAWQLPDGTMEVPIAGSHLSPYSSGTASNSFGNIFLQNSLNIDNSEGSLQLKAIPNPFRTITTIQLHPVESGEATVEVYNVQGVLIQRIFSGNLQAGNTKTFNLSATGLSPGVYIIHLKTKTKIISQKIILMR
jgi:parallel beta-helix repeat protein